MSTPAGWYDDPQNPGQQRYWDGAQWTEQRQPAAPTAPAPPPTAAPVVATTAVAPEKQKHTARNILIVLAVVFVLMGGCGIAVLFAAGDAVNDAVNEMEEQDKQPGGPDNPLEITEGETFSVMDFDYASGWSLAGDGLGSVTVKGLKVTNNRDDKDSAIVEIKLWSGTEVLAVIDCTTSPIDPGTTVTVDCLGLDKMPKNYDKITIQDTF